MTRPRCRSVRPSVVVLLVVAAVVVLGPAVAPWDPAASVAAPWGPANGTHLLGTDRLGRDVLSRTLHGGWRLTAVTLAALVVAYAVGFPAGLVAGLRPRAEGWVMRPVDVLVVLPWFLVLAVLATALGCGAPALVVAGALAAVPWVAKVVRGAALDEASAGYVEAAIARAEPWWHVAFREVAPNILPTVLADAGMRLTTTLSVITVGGYLGLGLPPDTPDWALDIAANQNGLAVQPWAVTGPALLLAVLVVAANLAGDGRGTVRPRRTSPGSFPGGAAALSVRDLTVRDEHGRTVLGSVTLRVPPGQAVAVVGESGAGKSTLVRAVAGTLPLGFTASGGITVGAAADRRRIGWVPQDPALALSPHVRVGDQIRDVLRAHGRPATAVAEILRGVGLPDGAEFARRHPFRLSGGQQQRVLLGLALIADPALLVLDEPTSGLDPDTARDVVAVVARRRAAGTAILLVTHDPEPVRHLLDAVVTVERGRVGPAAAPRQEPRRPTVGRDPRGAGAPVLTVRGLTAGYGVGAVLDAVDLDLRAGECVGLVGVSGAGKSTLGRCLVGLHPPTAGTIRLAGSVLAGRAAVRTVAERGAVQYVFQNPARSLNPRRTVGQELTAALRRGPGDRDAVGLLARVGLGPDLLTRRTSRLSGGQQQRVALARALATGPRVLVCDEIVSALDAENRRRILALLRDLVEQDGVAVLLISHDREAVDALADRVGVLDGSAVWWDGLRTTSAPTA